MRDAIETFLEALAAFCVTVVLILWYVALAPGVAGP